MGKRLMTDVLIAGSGVTGAIMAWQAFAAEPNAFMATLALINLATALFLGVVVRPLMRGKVSQAKVLPHVAMLTLLGAWSGAFWIEYLTVTHLPSALAGAITWSLAVVIYAADLLFSPAQEAATLEGKVAEPERELQRVPRDHVQTEVGPSVPKSVLMPRQHVRA
jgi:predicted membrane channel-forming protein YqfA (hemolysin III family)